MVLEVTGGQENLPIGFWEPELIVDSVSETLECGVISTPMDQK